MPAHPSGYEDRVTREEPRKACDNSAYEERIYQSVEKAEGGFTGEPIDGNLNKRVVAVRKVAQTAGHTIEDYPGENTWFIKTSLGADDGAYLELTLASGKAIKFVANPAGEYYNSLQICYDGITWAPVALNTDYASTATGIYAGKVWVRGRINHTGGVCPKFGGNADAITAVSGRLEHLLDYRAVSTVAPKYGVFRQMFQGCTALTIASGLVFPSATNPGNDIYPEMFDGCTALTAAPNLSAVTPSENSFFRMFRGCTALTTAPALPRVEVLPARAYTSMFFGCSHLQSINVYIGTRINGDALLDWMNGAGNAVDGQCSFNHSEGTFRWRYPSKSGIPGQDQSGQKEWTPIPSLRTKLFFSCGEGGSLTVSPTIQSGDEVTVGTAMTITPAPAEGFVFDSWISKPSASSVGTGGVLTFNMPYGRYDEGEDKVECICRFRNNKNLSVNYRIENTSSDLAFVRCPEQDALRGGQWMFAWTPGNTDNTTLMTGIGILYTATLAPQSGSILYKQDAAGNWFESAGTITSEVWTDNFTVIVFDNATSYSNSIKISVDGGSTYRNSYKSFCALTAPAGTSVTVTVYQSDGSTPVATADLHWSDDVTDNPRTVTVTAATKGICLSRDAN